MELLIISVGITLATELLKFVNKRFGGSPVASWLPHVLVFGFSLAAVILLKVVPEEFISQAMIIFSQAVAFYEVVWKRAIVPAMGAK